MKTPLARSLDGRTIHRADCRHARVPWPWFDDQTQFEVLVVMSTFNYRACRVCRPLAAATEQVAAACMTPDAPLTDTERVSADADDKAAETAGEVAS